MTTETRDWLRPGATVAVISTGRITGIKQISMDTVDSIGDKLITTLGHQFNLDTLEAPGDRAGMYQWRVADPESLQVKLDIAVQDRDKALNRVNREQESFNSNPSAPGAASFLVSALNRYRDAILEADRAAQALQDAA